MNQIQNSCSQYAAQPLTFFAAALLAGRLVQYFPGATPKGLLLSAAIGSTTTLAAQRIFASKDESAWYSLARNVACLALAAFLTPYAARSLKGRADITLPAAFRFCIVEGVIVAGLVFVSSRQATVNALYDKYANDLNAWKLLGREERTLLAYRFLRSDLPPLSLETASIVIEGFDFSVDTDFTSLSKNQLGWYVQMVKHMFKHTLKFFRSYEKNLFFAFNLALHQKGLPMEWGCKRISQDMVETARANPEYVDLFYVYFSTHPIEFAQTQNDGVNFNEMFNGKDPIPGVIEYLKDLDEGGLQQLSDDELEYVYSKYWIDDFKEFSTGQKLLINIALWNRLSKSIWLWPITQEIVDIARNSPDALRLLHHNFSASPIAFAAIEEDLRNQMRTLFTENNYDPIASSTTLLDDYTAEAILNFSSDDLWDCHTYFEKNLNVWNSQTAEKATAFIKGFIRQNLKPLPIDSIAIEFDQINSCQTIQNAASLKRNAVRWLLALEQKQSFLDTKVAQVLNLRLQEIEKEDP